MHTSKSELLEFVKDNDIKFIKLTFCDLLGRQRNISVLSSQLEDAYENGVAIDSSAMTGVGGIDLKLIPVSAMLSDLPWRTHSGRTISVYCKIADMYCKPYVCDPMTLLESQVKKLEALGFTANVATECEFYAFKDEVEGRLEPMDEADYCSCAPFDKCETIRRDVILSLEDMGLKPISSHHERGPGQNEVDFESADPLSAARNFIMFKAAVKSVCALNGAIASFMPKPLFNQPGSGLHLSIALHGKDKKDAKRASQAFIEGVLRRYKEITCLANPTLNSYKRLNKFYIRWSDMRRDVMRVFGDIDEFQLRTPDATCNPFTVLALVFAAGREGIEKGYELRPFGVGDDTIFENASDAVAFARKSEWLHENIPEQLDNVLDTIEKRITIASGLKTDRELFDFYTDI